MNMRRGSLAAVVAAALGLALFGSLANSTEPGPDKGIGPPPGGPPPPMMMPFPSPPIADALARAEVEIGIRSQQMDAWRDFTDAALSVLEPPRPLKPPRPDAKDAPAGEAQPFAKAAALADDAIARAKKAEQLKAAVEVLKTKLTPEQLKKVVELEARMVPPPPPPPPPPGGFCKMSPGSPPPSPHP